MKKPVVVIALMFAMLLDACSQIPGMGPTAASGPTVDVAGSATALFNTAVAESLTAQAPTFPPVSVTDTATPPIAPPATDMPAATFTPIETFTLPPDLTTTPMTATSGSPLPTGGTASATATPTLVPGQLTASPTLGIRKYGTLPPEVPFNQIVLINKANAEAYISLQVTMNDGKFSILEYPVKGSIKIKAPIGSYLYVAWVGGDKMTGNFRLNGSDSISITLYKNRVVIK